MFPADSWWNTEIAGAPVDAMSDAYIASLGPWRTLHAGFSADGGGIPFGVVDDSVPKSEVEFLQARASDPGPYPIPPDPPIQQSRVGNDRHLLLVHVDECRLYEMFQVFPMGGGWRAYSGAIWDMRKNERRPEGQGSADAAGLPMYPGLARYDEVAAGEIRHALRFASPITQDAYVFPASSAASEHKDPRLPPMGMRIRLKASVDLEGLPPQATVILRALQRYGMILADNGPPTAPKIFVDGAPDPRWDIPDLMALGSVDVGDFEVVETGPVMIPPSY